MSAMAMGSGSDIAMDAAMVTVLTPDLGKVDELMTLSQRTRRTIRENLFWAFIYNLTAVPIAAGVLYPCCGFLLDPMIGGAAMIGGHLSIADGTVISAATAVPSSITEAGQYSGVFPPMPHREWERNASLIRHLSDLRKRLRALEKNK